MLALMLLAPAADAQFLKNIGNALKGAVQNTSSNTSNQSSSSSSQSTSSNKLAPWSTTSAPKAAAVPTV